MLSAKAPTPLLKESGAILEDGSNPLWTKAGTRGAEEKANGKGSDKAEAPEFLIVKRWVINYKFRHVRLFGSTAVHMLIIIDAHYSTLSYSLPLCLLLRQEGGHTYASGASFRTYSSSSPLPLNVTLLPN